MSRCCNSCGMLTCNKDKERRADETELNWYSQENIDRLWLDGMKTGQYLVCHSTDPNAAEYGGDPGIKKGIAQACLGYTVWVFIHIKIYEHFLNSYPKTALRDYTNVVGKKIAIPRYSMMKLAMDFAMGFTGFGPKMGGMSIPREIQEGRQLVWPTGFDKVRAKFAELYPNMAGLVAERGAELASIH